MEEKWIKKLTVDNTAQTEEMRKAQELAQFCRKRIEVLRDYGYPKSKVRDELEGLE